MSNEEYLYNYSREVYTDLTGDLAIYNGKYDINNPMNPNTLCQDVFAGLGIECNMRCNKTTCSVIFIGTPLTEEQKTQLGIIVQAHKDYRP